MTPAKRRVALVAPTGDARTRLAEYLRKAGFDVHEFSELAVPAAFGSLVVITAPATSSSDVVADVRSRIKSAKSQRVVIVTSRPVALKELVATHGGRLHVLAAPAFGWDVVDALRVSEPRGPRGA